MPDRTRLTGFCILLALATLAQASQPVPQSGYDKMQTFGGPDGVGRQLKKADLGEQPSYAWEAPGRVLEPWYDWKGQAKNERGVALGVFASFLAQSASDTTSGDENAAGGIYRFHGSWTLLNNNKPNSGRIEWRVEARNNLGSAQAPSDLSADIGMTALNSAFGYSESFDTDLSVLNWTQGLANDRFGYAVGRLAFDVYLDAMPFQTFSGGFLNRSFLVNPTIGTTGIGALGAVAKGMIGENMILGAQIYDGNAASGKWDSTSIKEKEYLKAVDIAYVPSYARRKSSKIQFTYWEKDARDKAGIDSGNGWTVSANWAFGDKWLPFVRFGESDGGAGVAADKSLSGGFQYTVQPDQKWVFGAGWAKPNTETHGDDVRDEYVIETSYNFQVAKNVGILPDVQLLIDPANNPDKDRVWVGSLRAIVTF